MNIHRNYTDRISIDTFKLVRNIRNVMFVCCILALTSASAAWGYSLHPPQTTDDLAAPQFAPPPPPQGPDTPPPGYTPCPPQHRCPPPHQHTHHRYNRRRRKPLYARMILGESRLWLQPSTDNGLSHLLIDMRFLHVSAEGAMGRSKEFTFGGSIGAVDIRLERWLQPRGEAWGDVGLRVLEVAPFTSRFGGRHWYFDTMIMSYRNAHLALPAPVLARLWQRAKFTGAAPTDFASSAPMFLTPGARMGVRLRRLSLDASIALLDWDLGSYRAAARAHFRSHGIFVALETIFQQDQSQMQLKASDDHPESGAAIGALWQRATWDTQLLVELDLFRLASRKTRRLPASLHALLGVRYRHNLGHQLTDAKGARLFEEPAGGQWSFTVGLKLEFGR